MANKQRIVYATFDGDPISAAVRPVEAPVCAIERIVRRWCGSTVVLIPVGDGVYRVSWFSAGTQQYVECPLVVTGVR